MHDNIRVPPPPLGPARLPDYILTYLSMVLNPIPSTFIRMVSDLYIDIGQWNGVLMVC